MFHPYHNLTSHTSHTTHTISLLTPRAPHVLNMSLSTDITESDSQQSSAESKDSQLTIAKGPAGSNLTTISTILELPPDLPAVTSES